MARAFYITVTSLVRFALAACLCTGIHVDAHTWSPKAVRVVEIDTCTSSIVCSEPLLVDTGLVLLYQSCTTIADSLLSGNTAGRWCIQRIVGRNGYRLYLDDLPILFDVQACTQAVPVITGTTVRVDADVIVRSYHDGVGGVYAIKADTVVISATVDAVGAGYSGGLASLNTMDTSISIASAAWHHGFGGGKGHGPTSQFDTANAGRAAALLGGGGGNARNAGGAGGGHVGDGGSGGFQTSEYGSNNIGGIGGKSFTPMDASIILLGGGGGGGHQNDFLGSDGGSGGGIVVILCKVLILDSTARILCDGEHAQAAVGDGAGGGGAGGTIVLKFDTLITRGQPPTTILHARGGNGGWSYSSVRCYGPGGGGGGGRIAIVSPMQAVIPTDVSAGKAGRPSGTSTPCSQDSLYGARNGTEGFYQHTVLPPHTGFAPCGTSTITVIAHDSSGHIGESGVVRISVVSEAPLTQTVRLRMRVRARASVLWPEGAFWWSGRRYTTRYVTATLDALDQTSDELYLQYLCLLGDSSRVSVCIDSITVDPPWLRAEVRKNATFTVVGICNASNRERLFDPFANRAVNQSIHPADVMVDLLGRTFQISDPHSSTSWHRRRWHATPPIPEQP
ncbi:MAG: hypothetical protein J5I53_11095 [Bradyrhizobiaceae bacterium]|nr:hypothetical protein [Bradyrhizobiaceae bacterium]